MIVYEEESGVFVSAMLPTVAMSGVENEKLREIATSVEEKLKMVVDNVNLKGKPKSGEGI